MSSEGPTQLEPEVLRLRREVADLKAALELAEQRAIAARGTGAQTRAEEALRESEAFLDTIIEHSPAPMWVSDHAGTLIRMNQACRDLLHVTDEELVGKYNVLQDNIVEEQGRMPLVKRVFESGESVQFTLEYDSSRLRSLQLREQTAVVLEVTISPVLDNQNRVVHAVVQHHDITERVRAEKALRASEERFKRLLRNSNDLIVVTDARGVQLSLSGPVESMLGYEPRELIGRCAFDFMHPDDVDGARSVFVNGIAEPNATGRFEYRFRHKNGEWVPLEAVGTNLLHDAVVSGVVVNVRDVSERKVADLEKSRLQEQLQQAMKMEAVGRLAGGVAHDFNNLLTVIAGNTDLARMALGPADPLTRYIDEIGNAADSAASLTRQLLAFSRRQIIEPKVLNLNDLVENLQRMLSRLVGEDIIVQTRLAGDLGSVKVDPGQFDQVLLNLVVNARDAMPNGGRLLVETANVDLDEHYCALHPYVQPGAFVLLAVSDTGHGMDEEVKQRLFEPFFTTKPKGRGTGLGLATTFGAVKQAGGSVEVYSEIGHGTTIRIHLPRIDAQAGKLSRESLPAELPRGHETVLLVEDETSVRDVAQLVLKRLGYNVLPASDADEACRQADAHSGRIDLLMPDVVMPGMNGRELAERLSQHHPETRVLFTSGYTEDVIVHHGVVDERLHFISKPYSMPTLASKIREVLGPGN